MTTTNGTGNGTNTGTGKPRPATVEELAVAIQSAWREDSDREIRGEPSEPEPVGNQDASIASTIAARVAWDALHGEVDYEAAYYESCSWFADESGPRFDARKTLSFMDYQRAQSRAIVNAALHREG